MAANKEPWVRWFPSDWLGGTRGLTAAETGVYVTLVCLMYENRAPLPREDARQARQCGLPLVSFRKTLATLIDLGKIAEADGTLWNDRVAVELQNTIEKSEAARQSAGARWEKNKGKQGDTDASAVRRQSGRNANHNHTNPPKSPKGDFVLPTIREGDPLVPWIEKIRGRPILWGTSSTTTVTAEILEAAKALRDAPPAGEDPPSTIGG